MKKKNKNLAVIVLLVLLAVAIIYCIYVSTANMIDNIDMLNTLSKNELTGSLLKETKSVAVKAVINCVITDIVLVCSELVCLAYMVKKAK